MGDQPQAPQTVVNVNMANYTPTAAAQPPTAAPKPTQPKSAFVACVLFAVGGIVGLHRMYLNRPFLGWLLLLGAMAWGATQPPFGGAELLVLPLGLLLLDLFRIPRWVRQHNVSVATIAPSPLPAPAPVVAGTPAGAAAQPTITAAAPPPQKPKDLRTLLLHVAHRGDGKLTVTQAVMETGMDWKPIERCLRKMVRAGYVDVDNEPDSGVVVYVFPELVGRPRLVDDELPTDGARDPGLV